MDAAHQRAACCAPARFATAPAGQAVQSAVDPVHRTEALSHLPSSPDFIKEHFPFYWLARVHAAYAQEMERALKPAGLDVSTWRALWILDQQGASSMSDIALHSVAKLSTVAKLVHRMHADGLVEIRILPEDNRVTVVTITAHGRQALAAGRLATTHIFARSFDGFTPGEIERLNSYLHRLLENLSPRHADVAAGRSESRLAVRRRRQAG